MRKEGRRIKTASETRAENGLKNAKKQKYRDYFIEEHGCRSKRPYKMAKCVGPDTSESGNTSCVPTKIKTRKIKFVCPDGTSSRKEVEIVRKCGRKKQKIINEIRNYLFLQRNFYCHLKSVYWCTVQWEIFVFIDFFEGQFLFYPF